MADKAPIEERLRQKEAARRREHTAAADRLKRTVGNWRD